MNESGNSGLPALLALLLALVLGACRGEAEPPPLQGATMGGPISLTSHSGRRFDDRDLEGQYRIVYFGFASCPDVCPTDLGTISAALSRFEARDSARAGRVQPIFITVDPARDTPEMLRRYVEPFHPRLIGLTGSEAEIARVARAYGIYYARQPAPEGTPYLVDHSRAAVLYGPAGEPIAMLPTDQGPAAVAAELERWAR